MSNNSNQKRLRNGQKNNGVSNDVIQNDLEFDGDITINPPKKLKTNFIDSIDGTISVNGNITMSTGSTLETNDIVSKPGSDINIDAVGDQRINFGTLSNFGTSFRSAVDTNWSADFRNNVANYMVVAGTYNQAGDQRPQVGGHQISPLAWDVLWLNPVGISTALVCVGDQTRANIISKSAKFYVQGSTFTSGQIISSSSLKINESGSNSNIITGTPTASRTHTLQDKSGIIAHQQDCMIGFLTSATSISDATSASMTYRMNFTSEVVSKIEFNVNVPVGNTWSWEIFNYNDATVLNSGTIAGGSAIYSVVTTGFPTFTGTPLRLSFNSTNSVYGGTPTDIFSVSIYK